MEGRRMPFGQYRGRLLSELPDAYLCWLHDLNNLRQPLRAYVNAEYRARFGADEPEDGDLEPPARPVLAPELVPLAERIIGKGFRAVALELHPDHKGGDHRAMQQANAAHEALLALLRGAA